MDDVSRGTRLIKPRLLKYIEEMENIQERLTNALDEALEMTFPASDPIALTPPRAEEIAHDIFSCLESQPSFVDVDRGGT